MHLYETVPSVTPLNHLFHRLNMWEAADMTQLMFTKEAELVAP